jgi:multidrug transporter EmrE-like cation transporter
MGILKVIAYTCLVTAIEAVALFAMKYNSSWGIGIGCAIFGLGVAPLLHYALKHENVGMVNFIWTVFSVLFMFLVGATLFKEDVHYVHMIGVTMCVVGIGLILMVHEDFN